MRLLIRTVVLCLLVVTAAAVPAGARGRPTPRQQPPAASPSATPAGQPPTLATLKTRANQAAARFSEAQSVYARLGDQVAALERQVADLEGKLGPLRARVTRQAVALYQGDVAADAVNHFEAAAAMLQSDRSAHLVAEFTSRDRPAIEALLAAKRGVVDRRAELLGRRRDQDAKLADLAAQRDAIAAQLDELAAATAPKGDRRPLPRASRSAPLGQRVRGEAPEAPFVCPIDGPLVFSDDFGAPRGGGRRHMGNDLLSPRGTVNIAVVNGTIETRPWAGGGITIFLHADDGSTYVYMHLLQIEGAVPRRVVQGEVIGLTGATGHAFGYHTHFEYHPGGGDAVSPYPLLSAACR